MATLPDTEQQIVQTHAQLIHLVVRACHEPANRPQLEQALATATSHGWEALVRAIRRILGGERLERLIEEERLDAEDSVIARAILRGLANPATLPDPAARPSATLAAPGLAAMIRAGARGDVQAVHLLGNMAEQMSRAGGDMARLAGIVRRLLNGERDPDALARGMGVQGRELVYQLLEELSKLEMH